MLLQPPPRSFSGAVSVPDAATGSFQLQLDVGNVAAMGDRMEGRLGSMAGLVAISAGCLLFLVSPSHDEVGERYPETKKNRPFGCGLGCCCLRFFS